ncbi:MAG TPA: hypothetical protein VK914_03360 [bacterium]|jgi:hypothetical protein|nr:hypothetical protein [bacterium]
MPVEFEVYSVFITLLEARGWTVICASPPAGTDNRYRKCILPRHIIGKENLKKGLRDEVDITALSNQGDTVLLIEAKATLSDSLRILNSLGESDLNKLSRLILEFPPKEFIKLIYQGYGIKIVGSPQIIGMLAVGSVDCELPKRFPVIEVGKSGFRLFSGGVLNKCILQLVENLDKK